MRTVGETRFGVYDRPLIESALARPRHAAVYEEADLLRQASTLLFGLIKNHPWEGGNKRSATLLTDIFLRWNGFRIASSNPAIVDMCLKIESDEWTVAAFHDFMVSFKIPSTAILPTLLDDDGVLYFGRIDRAEERV